MRDRWYADNRDLIKWGVLLRLAGSFDAPRILQLAFYRPSEFGQLVIDGEAHNIPEEVIAHFRNLRTIGSISSEVRVTVFDSSSTVSTSHRPPRLSNLAQLQHAHWAARPKCSA
jgi:hypothetical protein